VILASGLVGRVFIEFAGVETATLGITAGFDVVDKAGLASFLRIIGGGFVTGMLAACIIPTKEFIAEIASST